MLICYSLREFLEDNKPITFDVVGGCGIDTSLGKQPCMGSYGIWFNFCPFCGKKLIRKYQKDHWEWWEE